MSNTFTRMGTANSYDNALRNLTSRQNALSSLQENVTSGKKILRASDDPTGAGAAERATTRIERIKVEQRALEVQKSAITQAESTLGSATSLLQSFRDLVVQAGNGANSPTERETIAKQLVGIRDELLELANRKDSNGMPLFNGLGSTAAPFETSVDGTPPDPDYTYNGLPGQSAASTVAIPFTLDGRATWMDVPESNGVFNVSLGATNTGQAFADIGLVTDATTAALPANGYDYTISFTAPVAPATGATTYAVTNNTTGITSAAQTYTAGQSITMGGISVVVKGVPANGDTMEVNANVAASRPSIFGVLDRAIAAMYAKDAAGNTTTTGANSTDANFNHEQAISLAQIDTSLEKISSSRGKAGDLLTRADRITDTQSKNTIQSESDRSNAEDLDMIAAIADQKNQQTAYQAALQSYASIQKLSLFNYIG
ncbi:flagellar hook-associated protein 3 FlgL [Rhodoferax ferrireducens]|uniref:Flagellar hook-associated protein 3 FlgL n=1 Tax=Rhodoferax ferrireducens TaxID=192843 RepID=A0ABU2CE08_9BURK|nr:flagellar hook-associated protein FlgL [Rhodoferax ferrireducens]MDR7379574.1 flagellar hook-associated protein 3 FlgL [Rhodoferax ferrireducens]